MRHPEQWLLHFSVRDTGIGIPMDKQDRLFKSFQQVDASTTRHYGGTGLGLAICKRLAELMGGNIWVESDAGKGATFHFTIARQGRSAHRASPTGRPRSRNWRANACSWLKTTPTNRADHPTARRQWGMSVSNAPPTAARRWPPLAASPPFDLAILDLQLPGHRRPRARGRNPQAASSRPLCRSFCCPPSACEATTRGPRDAGVSVDRPQAHPAGPTARRGVPARSTSNCSEKRRRRPSRRWTPVGRRLPLRVLLADDNPINQKVA